MKTKTLLLQFILLGLSISLSAQTPASATINLNNVKFTIHADGSLFQENGEGAFIAPYEEGEPEISLFRGSGLWIAGENSSGELRGAIQAQNQNGKKDFVPVPTLNKIWRVTAQDIAEHQADFADNGIIDNPNQNVFSWPGRNNQFFENYNEDGLEMLDPTLFGAPYFDLNSNGIYDPDAGEFPILQISGCENDEPMMEASEVFWFCYTDDTEHTQSGLELMNLVIETQVYAFGCQEDNPYNNSVFVKHKLINTGIEELSSLYMGVFADFDIGSSDDDYIGTDPERNLLFAYNGNETDEAYGNDIPAASMDLLRGPYNALGDTAIVEADLSTMQLLPEEINDLTGLEYYNLLKGLNADGSLSNNGPFAYPDDPNTIDGDSEVGAGNLPGERKALGTYGPIVFKPGAVNEIIIAYSFTQENSQTPLENVTSMYEQNNDIQALFDNCLVTTNCSPLVSSTIKVQSQKINVSPNPVSTILNVESNLQGLQEVVIVSLSGNVVYWETGVGSSIEIPVNNLANGIYFLEVIDVNGKRAQEKVVVQH
ncbi:MAG: T9SS type A sorting domain-containing protein [Saprospiraceae bacterium]